MIDITKVRDRAIVSCYFSNGGGQPTDSESKAIQTKDGLAITTIDGKRIIIK